MKYLVDLDLSLNQLKQVVAENLSKTQIDALTAAEKKEGRFLYDSDNKSFQYWNGTEWVILKSYDAAIIDQQITAALDALDYTMTETTGLNVVSQVTQSNGKVAAKTRTLSITKANVGLGNVDNTSDANKPVSTAQANAIAQAKTDAIAAGVVSITKNGNDYTISQTGNNIGTINIPKDMVVESGEIVAGAWADGTFTPGTGTGKALALVIANGGGTVYIDVADLVDAYTGGNTTTINVTISAANKITATLNNGSVTKTHLATALVTELTSTTITAPAASSTQATAGTKSIKDLFQTIVNNIKQLFDTMGNKVDKVAGKGLSTNDYTTADKHKLAGITTKSYTYVSAALTGANGTIAIATSGLVANKPAVLQAQMKGEIVGIDMTFNQTTGAITWSSNKSFVASDQVVIVATQTQAV